MTLPIKLSMTTCFSDLDEESSPESLWWAKVKGSAATSSGMRITVMRVWMMISVRSSTFNKCKSHHFDVRYHRYVWGLPTYHLDSLQVGGTPWLIRSPFRVTSRLNGIRLVLQFLGAMDFGLHQTVVPWAFLVCYKPGTLIPGQGFWILPR